MQKKKVMIVDDDLEFLDEMTVLLYLEDYDVISVTNGNDALATAEKTLPDIILTDIKMRDMSGLKVAHILSNSDKTRNIPIVAITGIFTGDKDEKKMRDSGIRKRLIKPIDPGTVKEEIENTLAEKIPYPDIEKSQ